MTPDEVRDLLSEAQVLGGLEVFGISVAQAFDVAIRLGLLLLIAWKGGKGTWAASRATARGVRAFFTPKPQEPVRLSSAGNAIVAALDNWNHFSYSHEDRTLSMPGFTLVFCSEGDAVKKLAVGTDKPKQVWDVLTPRECQVIEKMAAQCRDKVRAREASRLNGEAAAEIMDACYRADVERAFGQQGTPPWLVEPLSAPLIEKYPPAVVSCAGSSIDAQNPPPAKQYDAVPKKTLTPPRMGKAYGIPQPKVQERGDSCDDQR